MKLTEAINCTNVLQYAAANEKCFENILAETNKERMTTFFSDLSIAEWCEKNTGERNAVRDTYKRVCKEWIKNYKFFVEFIVSLNHKCWMWYGADENLSKLYGDLYYEARDVFYEHYEGNEEACRYMFEMTD